MKNKFSILIGLLAMFILILAGCSSAQSNQAVAKEKEEKTTQTNSKEQTAQPKYIFTANEGGSISKIKAENKKGQATIEVEGIAHNVQVSPNGKVLGVTLVTEMAHGHDNDGSMDMKGKALFFDTDNNELIEAVTVGNHPAHIVFTENGKYALVSNNEDNTVSVIDMKTFSVIEDVPTGNGPHGFRISQDSKFAYVANMGEDTISVINLETLQEEKKITVGQTPVTTGITSNGKTLVATINSENVLAIVDLETNLVKKVAVGNGPAQLYIDSTNKFAYVANQGTEESPSNTMTIVDLELNETVATIETGEGSHGVVISSDNKFAYVTNMFDNTVSV
ncbi:MAG: YncE family protein, partial [Bacillus sp. (in: firmicutes)]